MNFIDELEWRGMIQDFMPGTREQLEKEMTSAYVGIDPTADSLHIGHLVSVMMLRHFQRAGHRPILLIGGATGMIGDPSGKSAERNLLDEATLRHNQDAIRAQLSRLIDFDSEAQNAAIVTNNYDWMSQWSFLDFVRDIGKLITVNYMMAKDSVKRRFSGEGDGMSFTEFTYQLLQGYDFVHLYENYNCKLQMGGSDQWGNITTGTELIRRKIGGEGYGLTCPLIRKADGTKFGKTEQGNIWLDARYTTPYRFYQFWLGVSDTDAESYIKIFTFLDQPTIEALVARHTEAPHLRELQKTLAREITVAIHGEAEYEKAVAASGILFGGKAAEALALVDEATLLDVFAGVPQFEISLEELQSGIDFGSLCTEKAAIFASKGELRRLITGGGISLCGEKVAQIDQVVDGSKLISGKFLLVQKGKKNYFLIKAL
ncbi:MAG: tyrosine--tRNA ligase [Rikenellaceae bacterium]